MLVFHDRDTLLHETVELLGAKLIPAQESPDRIKSILSSLKDSTHDIKHITTNKDTELRTIELARLSHGHEYLRHLESVHSEWVKAGLIEPTESVIPECFRLPNSANPNPAPPKDIYARAGYYAFDMSSCLSHGSWRSIVASANLAVTAVDHVLSTPSDSVKNQESNTPSTSAASKSALALCRPPGHHCDGQKAGGYCYINNIALCVSHLRNRSRAQSTSAATPSSSKHDRVLILDLDFHHGNGTQEIFYNDPALLYVSIHGEDEFPYYTGSASETGGPDAPNLNINLPLIAGSSFDAYQKLLSTAWHAIEEFEPQFLLVSLGFDTFHLDPLGAFKIDTDEYAELGRVVRSQPALKNLPAVIVLEGGYVVDRLGANLLSFLRGWEDGERD